MKSFQVAGSSATHVLANMLEAQAEFQPEYARFYFLGRI
jgi:hypothetical protein